MPELTEGTPVQVELFWPVPPLAFATMPVTFAAVPETLPVTLPVRLAVIVLALKLPEASRFTMVDGVLALVAALIAVEPELKLR